MGPSLGRSTVDTVLEIGFFSVLVLFGVAFLASIFTFVGHALAVEAVEDDPHGH